MHFRDVTLRGATPPPRPFVMEPTPKDELFRRLVPASKREKAEEKKTMPVKTTVEGEM